MKLLTTYQKKKTIDIVSNVEGSSGISNEDINNAIRIDQNKISYPYQGYYYAGNTWYPNIPTTHGTLLSTLRVYEQYKSYNTDVTYYIVTKWLTSDVPYSEYNYMVLWNYTISSTYTRNTYLGNVIDKYVILPSSPISDEYFKIYFTLNTALINYQYSNDNYMNTLLQFAIEIDGY